MIGSSKTHTHSFCRYRICSISKAEDIKLAGFHMMPNTVTTPHWLNILASFIVLSILTLEAMPSKRKIFSDHGR